MAEWKEQRFEPTYQPVLFVDSDKLIQREDFSGPSFSSEGDKLSMCIRRKMGNSTRGGHYVNARINSKGEVLVSSLTRVAQAGEKKVEAVVFREDSIVCESLSSFCEFLNHYSGRKFSSRWYTELVAISTGNRPPGLEF